MPSGTASTPDTTTSGTPLKDLTKTFSFMNGASYDVNGNPVNTITQNISSTTDINDALNSGQESALGALTSNPLTDPTTRINTAQSKIDEATANLKLDRSALATATSTDLSKTAVENYDTAYTKTGVAQAEIDVQQAQEEYNRVALREMDNLSQREQQYEGTGATTGDVKNINSLDQRSIAISKFAAATKLQVAQQKLNSATDMFRELYGAMNSADKTQVDNQIRVISTQLGIDETFLSNGTSLLNQALQESNQDTREARQTIINLATHYPGLYDSLSEADKQALQKGQITPTITAALGKAAVQEQNKTAVMNMQGKYIDAGILPTDTIESATLKVKANSAIYKKEVAVTSGSGTYADTDVENFANGVFSGSMKITAVPAKIRGQVDARVKEMQSNASAKYGSATPARIDYNIELQQAAKNLESAKNNPSIQTPMPSQMITYLKNNYGKYISEQEIEGTVYGMYGAQPSTTQTNTPPNRLTNSLTTNKNYFAPSSIFEGVGQGLGDMGNAIGHFFK